MHAELVIQNADILIGNTMMHGSLAICDGKIAALGQDMDITAHETVDGTGRTILPGLMDMHVHLRDPGQTQKEDIFTGTRAALAGGITQLCCMPNTSPPIDNPDTVRYILDKASETGVSVHPIGCITRNMDGQELCDYGALKNAGVIALSDDGKPVSSAQMMRRALTEAYSHDLPVISHCEDLSIIDGGIVNARLASETLGVKGMDRTSEDIITAREVILAADTHTRVHIAHVSTAGSVEIIRQAKAHGVQVTCETCPHYFLMTEREVLYRDADYRMNPPLRTEEDRRAVLEGLLDGTIDCIVTDHAPHTPEEKADFLHAPNGVIGMETSFAASMQLVHAGLMTLSELVAKMSDNPRRILGLPQKRIAVGQSADIMLADLNYRWTVEPEKLHGKSRNAVWKHKTLVGKPIMTLTDGIVRYRDEEYFAQREKGRKS